MGLLQREQDGERRPTSDDDARNLTTVRLVAEFTTEPYHGEGDPPPHAQLSWEVIQAAGLAGDFGPLGTQFSGDAEEVLDTLRAVLATALGAGARRVTIQLEPED